METFEAMSIATGRALIRMGNDPDLEDDPALWCEVWEQHRDEILTVWISQHPGQRPNAYWLFEEHDDDQADDESEPAYWYRQGVIDPEEMQAIRAKALELVGCNVGRMPGDQNYIEDAHGLLAFALDNDLLTLDESPFVI